MDHDKAKLWALANLKSAIDSGGNIWMSDEVNISLCYLALKDNKPTPETAAAIEAAQQGVDCRKASVEEIDHIPDLTETVDRTPGSTKMIERLADGNKTIERCRNCKHRLGLRCKKGYIITSLGDWCAEWRLKK